VLNPGDVGQSGLTLEIGDVLAGLTVNAGLADTSIVPLGSVIIEYTLSATGEEFGDRPVIVTVSSNEGGHATAQFNVSIRPPQAKLVANPSSLSSGMLRSTSDEVRQTFVNFAVTNIGAGPTGGITVLTPTTPWLSLNTPRVLEPLGAGQSATIGLVLSPAFDLDLGLYTGSVVVNGSNTNVTVPFQFNNVSDGRGDLEIITEDEFSYFAEGLPKLAGATVNITDATTKALVATGTTDVDGSVVFLDLTEAYYDIEVRAEKHQTFRNAVQVIRGEHRVVRAFLSRQAVTYNWTVEPAEIEDEYIFTLDVVFETVVPQPVITIEPAYIDLNALNAEFTQIDFVITNHGLITTNNGRLHFQGNERFRFTPLVEDLGDITAQTSITVPVIIQDMNAGAGAIASAVDATSCFKVSGGVTSFYFCGRLVSIWTPIGFLNNLAHCLRDVDLPIALINPPGDDERPAAELWAQSANRAGGVVRDVICWLFEHLGGTDD
jgi:hypothetical protein